MHMSGHNQAIDTGSNKSISTLYELQVPVCLCVPMCVYMYLCVCILCVLLLAGVLLLGDVVSVWFAAALHTHRPFD